MGSVVAMTLVAITVFLVLMHAVSGQSGCEAGAFVYKSHTWNKGYVGKLYLAQSWLAQQTADWRLDLTFASQLLQFKVWDADILSPATTSNYVSNVTSLSIM